MSIAPKNYYETHVTMTSGTATKEHLKSIVEAHKGWRFSAIEGDINLGDGVKFYATKQFNGRFGTDAVINYLRLMADVLRNAGAHVIREKVEIVVYDTRSSKVQCIDCATCQEVR